MKGLLLKEKTSIQNTSKLNIVIDHNEAKNLTHVKKVGTLQNFCWVFTDELEKQLFIKKTAKVDQ